MTRKFCDMCGKTIDAPRDSEYKVQAKKRIYSWGGESWWNKLEICEYCKKAIVLKSEELRQKEKVSK